MAPLRLRHVWTGIGYGLVGLVVVVSLAPAPTYLIDFPWMDKWLHVLTYAVLMLWFAQLYPKSRYRWLACDFIALGIILEVLQSLLGHRTGEVGDAIANSLGAALSWVLAAKGMNTLFHQFENLILKPDKDE